MSSECINSLHVREVLLDVFMLVEMLSFDLLDLGWVKLQQIMAEQIFYYINQKLRIINYGSHEPVFAVECSKKVLLSQQKDG